MLLWFFCHTVYVHSYQHSHGISILLGLGTQLIIPLLCAISLLYPAREPKHAHTTWPTALPSLCFTIIASRQSKSIYGVIVFVGRSIQEMAGNVVIGYCIYGVVVINGSLYSRFYGNSQARGRVGHPI